MAKNEAKVRFTAETGEFNSAIKKANSEMQELRAEMKLNEAQMKSTGATVEGLESKHKILSNQLAASESKTEALAQKVDKAAEIFGENSDEVTKLRTQLLNAQAAEEKIKQAISACNAELDEQRNAMKQTESASKQLADTIDKQQNELNQLKSDYASAVLEHGKYSREARTLAKQIDSLSDELNENQKRMNEVEAAADKLDNNMDNLDETAEAVSEGFTVMKGAMADLVADGIEKVASGIAEIGTEAFTMSNDIDKATNTFIAKTGASVDSAEGFEDVMTNIYRNNYGESFEDIAESAATVKTALGDISNDELEKVTTDALILRDTFDMDVNESIRAVNSMMDQFGITADEAYNLIAQGAQNGLNQNDDLLDTVNEYSVQFKNAGYSAEDMFNMLANGVDAGTWSVDKLGDAVKEFNIRASDGTVGEAIKENAKAFGMTEREAKALASQVENGSVGAYQKLADKLRAVDNDTQRYQLGVSMFGTMWEDLGEEAVFALLDTQGQISSTTDAMGQLNSVKYDDLGSAIKGIKRNLQMSVSKPIKNEVMPAVNEFVQDVDWEGVGQTIGEVMGVAVDAFFGLVEVVKETVQWMNEHKTLCGLIATAIGIVAVAIGAYNVVNGIKNAMDAANVTTVWALVAAHVAQAAAAMAAIAPYVLIVAAIAAVIAIIVLLIKNWDDVVAACKNAWEKVKETLATWGEWINTNAIQPVVKFFKGLWADISTACSEAWEWIKEAFAAFPEWVNNNVISPVVNFFKGLWEDITSACSDAWEWVKGVFSSFVDWVNSNFIQPVVNFFTGLWDSLKAIWDGICNVVQVAIMLMGEIISAAVQIITVPFRFIWENCKEYVFAAWEWIKTKVTNAINTVKTVITNVMNGIKSVISTVWNAIKTATSTVWEGIKSVITKVWDTIKSAVTTAINAVKTKVTSIWNSIKSVSSTVWNGIKSVLTTVWNAIKTAVTSAVDAVKTKVTSIWNSIKSTTTSVWNSIKGAISSAWSSIKSSVTSAIENVKSKISSVWNSVKSVTSSAWNAVKSAVSNVWNGIKSNVSNAINNVKSAISNGLNSAKSTVSNILGNIKEKFSSVFDKTKDIVKNAIDKIKSFFNFSWSLPKIKLPHFSISGKFSLNPPSIPKFSVSWYKDGAIFTKPTLFNTPYGLKGVGEAGAEAVLPIEKLEDYISGAIERTQNAVNLNALASAIEDLANRPINLYANGRQIAVAMAGDSDSVNGFRSTLQGRGLTL